MRTYPAEPNSTNKLGALRMKLISQLGQLLKAVAEVCNPSKEFLEFLFLLIIARWELVVIPWLPLEEIWVDNQGVKSGAALAPF
jgi:hypothetical protein